MNTKDSTKLFMSLYHDVYQYLHSTWKKSEQVPSLEAIAVIKHLNMSGPLTISEAAQHFNRAQSAMSELVDRLQTNGYIDRIKDSRDRRRTLVWLTEAGRRVYEKSQEVLDRELLQETIERLPENEREMLINGMRALVETSQSILLERTQKNEKQL